MKHSPKERDDFSERNPTENQQVRLVTGKHKSIGGVYDRNLPLHARPPELLKCLARQNKAIEAFHLDLKNKVSKF